MLYKGKQVSLREYVETIKKQYQDESSWKCNEGIVYAILDYAGCVPYEDWSNEDKKYLEETELTDVIDLLNEE